MPYLARCNQCGAVSESPLESGRDPDASVACGCCPQAHDHAAAANACPRGHEGQPCPHPEGKCTAVPAGQACPGGHCGLGVAGCTVCRPVTVIALGDSARLALAVWGGE